MAAMPRPQPHTHPLLHLRANILDKTLGTALSCPLSFTFCALLWGALGEKVEITHFPPEDVAYS